MAKAPEIDAREVARLQRVAKVAAGMTRCRVIHGSYPEGTTCLDVVSIAADLKRGRFADEFRSEILAGLNLCEGCRLAAAFGTREPKL
jgi:hypothetical protein